MALTSMIATASAGTNVGFAAVSGSQDRLLDFGIVPCPARGTLLETTAATIFAAASTASNLLALGIDKGREGRGEEQCSRQEELKRLGGHHRSCLLICADVVI
jgi:hypothetical protein